MSQAPPDCSGTLDARFFQSHDVSAKSSTFINMREICDHHKLPPGEYVVVPSTYEPNDEGDFILRVYSERKNDQVQYVGRCTVFVQKGFLLLSYFLRKILDQFLNYTFYILPLRTPECSMVFFYFFH